METITITTITEGTLKAFQDNKIFDNFNPNQNYRIIDNEKANQVFSEILTSSLSSITTKVLIDYLKNLNSKTVKVDKSYIEQVIKGKYKDINMYFYNLFGRYMTHNELKYLSTKPQSFIDNFVRNLESYESITFVSFDKDDKDYISAKKYIRLNYNCGTFTYHFADENDEIKFIFTVSNNTMISKVLSKYSSKRDVYNKRFKNSFKSLIKEQKVY